MPGFLSKLKDALTGQGPGQDHVVTVVSGLPRSGTSMMMKMLEAGGIEPLTDEVREADIDNPKGYYEFERVKKLDKGDVAWVSQAEGRSVKVISALLKHLPRGHTYKVLFMRRALDEILASQTKMLQRREELPDEEVSDEELKALFVKHLQHVQAWSDGREDVELIEVSYNDLLEDPERGIQAIAAFLDRDLDTRAMAEVIDPNLYRNRKDQA